ncbi:hypothetical protein NM208_g8908 [Fusarium decemcellulare]|uniref:Uncharacterized protein n=1 Tax=Fusarium decemcellulare TaxID=57161 RepID=A0ACC1S3I5_9HYPO|nr:hypothetical protein NM208_g8908 [Fusarium decemcellulare]
MSGTISTQVSDCLKLFSNLDGTSNDSSDNPLEVEQRRCVIDEHRRFIRWARNIGAYPIGAGSLEYHLQDTSHVRDQVIRLINYIKRLLEDAISILSGERVPWEHLDDDEVSMDEEDTFHEEFPETELDQIIRHIGDGVEDLLHLSTATRNPAPHDRVMGSQSIDTDHFLGPDIEHVKEKFQKTDEVLANRLGTAITARRRYFKYRKAHHDKLSSAMDPYKAAGTSAVIRSILPQLDDSSENDDDSDVVIKIPSTTSATGEAVGVPVLPKHGGSGRPFECPYCYVTVSVSSQVAWE